MKRSMEQNPVTVAAQFGRVSSVAAVWLSVGLYAKAGKYSKIMGVLYTKAGKYSQDIDG